MLELNPAQQIMRHLGLPTHADPKAPNRSFTKKGPSRTHMQGDGKHNNLTIKQARSGMFGKGLRNAITQKNMAKILARKEAA